jgi:hypothetical protein
MRSKRRVWFVSAVVLFVALPLTVAMASYRGKHPYESGQKAIAFGYAEQHQYRLYPDPDKPTRTAHVNVRATSPGLWVCAVAAYRDCNGQWNSICEKDTTSGNVRYGGVTRISLDLAVPEGCTIGWLTITVENRYLRSDNTSIIIHYSLETY